ncbi:COG3650 family protein [Vibrio sp.]|uniref:COG3650 family protein n=1 Tax=Vibrio sp. TaxID=678 RepID=UPI003D1415EB
MKMVRILTATLALLFIQACSQLSTSPSAPQPVTVATLGQPETIQPQSFLLRGQLVIGPEVRSFTPCGSQQQYWLDLTSAQAEQLIPLARAPYQPLYAELIGTLTIPSETGFNADYVGRFQVQTLNLVSAENPQRCQLAASGSRMFGTEPFWSARFVPGAVEFEPMGQTASRLPITSQQLSATERHYQLQDGEARITAQYCNDGMSDSLYGWQASLTIRGEQYWGCASLGNQDGSRNWVGHYFASSTQTSQFTISLELKPDHSASTRYEYNNGDPAILETGFWQPLNETQILVVMTQHQGQYLVSQRIFTLDGEQLSAKQEQVGDIVYPIADGGLVLFRGGDEAATGSSSNMAAGG